MQQNPSPGRIPRPSEDAERSAQPCRGSTASTRNCRRISRGSGAHGHAQPDLARPLGDRDQHDVHNADAADDQRNQSPRTSSRLVISEVVDVSSALVISVMSRTVKSSGIVWPRMRWRSRSRSVICWMAAGIASAVRAAHHESDRRW